MREMITKLETFDCWTNSPFLYQGKCIEKSIKNMDTDHRVQKGSLQWQHLGIDDLRLWLVCMSKLKEFKKELLKYVSDTEPPATIKCQGIGAW